MCLKLSSVPFALVEEVAGFYGKWLAAQIEKLYDHKLYPLLPNSFLLMVV